MTASLDERMGALRQRYLIQLRERREVLARLLRDPVEKESGYKEMGRLLHGLVGGGKTYGFPDVSARAREMEEKIINGLRLVPSDADDVFASIDHALTFMEDDFCNATVLPDQPNAYLSDNPSILLVDADPEVYMFLSDVFAKKANVLWAKNTAIARTMLENNTPGIILMDSPFAAVAGDELLHDLRESEHYQKIPVLILTTAARGSDAVQCLISGATDCIVKPLERVSLYEKVRDILNERALCLKG